MKGAVIVGILAGWIAADQKRDREVELLTLAVFGPLLLKAQFAEEPRPVWASQMMLAGGSAAVTYRMLGLMQR